MSEPSWELLGGGGVIGGPINYVGAWAAGTTYQPGQVVRYNGIDYLAVTPSVGQVPPGAVSALLPQPIVNGRWVKGVGGAAVWSPIVATDVPGLVTADTSFITMSLLSGSHYGAPYGPVQYRKLASGLVICQGLFSVATAGAAVFTFPAGYRPASGRDLIFKCACNVEYPETWRLDGTGSLRPNASIAAGNWISMSGLQFYAEG
jgi:hypothetical protein